MGAVITVIYSYSTVNCNAPATPQVDPGHRQARGGAPWSEADLRAVFGADGRPPKTFMSLLLDSDDEGSDSDDEPAAVGEPPPVGALD